MVELRRILLPLLASFNMGWTHPVPAGHPLAGTEHSGPRSGFAELFENRFTILLPSGNADVDAVARLTRFWEGMGAKVETMDIDHHDLVLAVTSHAPHLTRTNDNHSR